MKNTKGFKSRKCEKDFVTNSNQFSENPYRIARSIAVVRLARETPEFLVISATRLTEKESPGLRSPWQLNRCTAPDQIARIVYCETKISRRLGIFRGAIILKLIEVLRTPSFAYTPTGSTYTVVHRRGGFGNITQTVYGK